MKKLTYILAAAAVILSACSKEQIVAPVSPVDVPDCSFVGEFAMNKESKTTMLPGVEDYLVMWENADVINVTAEGTGLVWPFVANNAGVSTVFTPQDTKTKEELAAFFAASSFTATFGNASSTTITIAKDNVRHLNMAASCGTERVLTFAVDKPVLSVEIPASVSAKSLSVNPRGSDTPVVSLTCSESVPVFYVPVPVAEAQYDIHAYSGENCTTEIAESMKMQVAAQMVKGKIYPFEFTPTLEISAAGDYELKSYPANYRVKILGNKATLANVGIAYGGEQHPVNVYMDAKGNTITSLTVNTSDSHFELENGESANVTSNTSKNSLVLKPSYKINTVLTVNEGNVYVEGHEGAANCAKIEIPKGAEDITISINEVTTEQQVDQVLVVNYADQEDVKMIGVENHEYYYQQGEPHNPVTEVTGVAAIGNTRFETLDGAFAAAKSGETVKLLSNISLSARQELVGKDITLDLQNFDITYSGATLNSGILLVHNGAGLTITGTGNVSSGSNAAVAIALTKKGEYNESYTAKLVVKGGNITGQKYGIAGNGTRHNTAIYIEGGSITGTTGPAIYNPQNGIINISGGSLVGTEGIYMKSGAAVAATGGSIHAVGPKGTYAYDGNGESNTGDAIIVDNCNYPGGRPSLTVSGATLVSDNAYQIGAYYHTPETGISDIYSTNNTLTVPAGYSWVAGGDGLYKLAKDAEVNVAKIGTTYYTSLADAFAAAAGQTNITLELIADVDLKNEAWSRVVFNNNTFDGKGHTIKNLSVANNGKESGTGFIGNGDCSTIKNLIIDGATVTGVNQVGVVAGRGMCTKIENCQVKNATVTSNVLNNDDGDKAGVICGYLSGEWQAWVRNCTVTDCSVTAYRDLGAVVGYAECYASTPQSTGIADISDNVITNVQIICNTNNNYKKYKSNVECHANQVVGELTTNATATGNTVTNVTVSYVPGIYQAGSNTTGFGDWK